MATRTQATSRTLTTTRRIVRDFKTCLVGDQATTKIALTQTAGLPLQANANHTFACFFRPNKLANNETIFSEGSGSSDTPFFLIDRDSTKKIRVRLVNDAGTVLINSVLSTQVLERGTMYHIIWVDANGTCKLYVNGVEDAQSVAGAFNYANAGTFTYNRSTLMCLTRTTSVNFASGSLNDVYLFSKALSASEVANLYYRGVVPSTNLVAQYPLNEGAGTVAKDISGNGNTGTITAPNWSNAVNFRNRKLVGGNLVPNGDFEYAPPFTAATNANSRFIDGTSGGSTTNSNFYWNMGKSGTVAAYFDPVEKYSGSYSLKISTLAVASYVEIFLPTNTGAVASYFAKTVIPVLPSTSYTYSFYVKTNYVSGDSSAGFHVAFIESLADGSTASKQLSLSYIKTTTPWTHYTGTFTTGASSYYLQINPVIYGHTGTATLIMDAWIDNMSITPTTNTTRTLV